MDEQIEAIRKYWDERGQLFGSDPKATLGEPALRRLEIRTMAKLLKRLRPSRILDAGCGNGYSTKRLAAKLPGAQFVGMDYSMSMIESAREESIRNCDFVFGDMLRPETLPSGKFDVVITQRSIQNLPTYEYQCQAITNLRRKLSHRGSLVLMECSRDGVEQLNQLRKAIGKGPLERIEPWHNLFFSDKSLRNDYGARIICFSSTYMFLSKAVNTRLSLLAALLPPIGKFGYDKLYLISPDDVARSEDNR